MVLISLASELPEVCYTHGNAQEGHGNSNPVALTLPVVHVQVTESHHTNKC